MVWFGDSLVAVADHAEISPQNGLVFLRYELDTNFTASIQKRRGRYPNKYGLKRDYLGKCVFRKHDAGCFFVLGHANWQMLSTLVRIWS